MSKIFVVIKHDVDYIDKPVKFFLSRREADAWVENNFVPTLNTDPSFCDFIVKEEDIVEDPNPIIQGSFVKGKVWINAFVSIDFKEVRFSSFREEDEDDDLFKEVAVFIRTMGEYNVFCRLPRDLKTRMDVAGYVKWFARNHVKKV